MIIVVKMTSIQSKIRWRIQVIKPIIINNRVSGLLFLLFKLAMRCPDLPVVYPE